ncbi:MAG: hypothetical protein SBU_000106 [Candidatus Syntrophoarchaeum butanivorans]|uniref:Uncharacterized protein n=1 Tax=Candidatus Syntropharchaeum butanivorans TaxID=1839936 RepID=A0A1F2P6M9_9EURY|nr:MAG: hypothetical protein SBU_000106 [Candidatus Syntrophoarchaeum butanivorans]
MPTKTTLENILDKPNILKILCSWEGRKEEWLRWSEIKKQTGLVDVEVSRGLNALVKFGLLERKLKGRTAYYRPTFEFIREILRSSDIGFIKKFPKEEIDPGPFDPEKGYSSTIYTILPDLDKHEKTEIEEKLSEVFSALDSFAEVLNQIFMKKYLTDLYESLEENLAEVTEKEKWLYELLDPESKLYDLLAGSEKNRKGEIYKKLIDICVAMGLEPTPDNIVALVHHIFNARRRYSYPLGIVWRYQFDLEKQIKRRAREGI